MVKEIAPWLLEQQKSAADERWLATRPRCGMCGQPIREEEALELEGTLICRECQRLHTVCVDSWD